MDVAYGSNVAPMLFGGGGHPLLVSMFENRTLYMAGASDALTSSLATWANWNLCYQFTGGEPYYYYAVGWVFGEELAQNPSCQPVQLTLEG